MQNLVKQGRYSKMKSLYDFIPPSLAYSITLSTIIIGLIVVSGIIFLVIKNPIAGSRKEMPHKIFLRICILGLINMLLSLFVLSILSYTSYETHSRFRAFQSEICYFLYGFSWFFLMDYIIRRDNSRIKKNNIRAVVLVTVIIITRLIMSRIAIGEDNTPLSGVRDYLSWISFPLELMVVLLAAAFMMHGVFRIRGYQKGRKELFGFRLDFYFYPWLVGVLLNLLLAIDIEGLCSACSIALTYFALKKRDRCIDWDTGLFNENYLDYYDEFAREFKFVGKAALSIETANDIEELIPIVRRIVTETSFIIRRRDGRFFIVLSAAERMAVEVMKKNLQDAAHNNAIYISMVIRQFMKNSYESENEFVQRAFKESTNPR